MHVMVKDRTAELKSEATVALDLLATRCKKENGKLEIWVSAKASLCVCSCLANSFMGQTTKKTRTVSTYSAKTSPPAPARKYTSRGFCLQEENLILLENLKCA